MIKITDVLRYGLLGIMLLAGGSADAQVLLAGWTFNDQSSTPNALTADEGTLAGSAVLTPAAFGSNQTLTLNGNGTISLGSGEALYTSAINSTSFPQLQSGVTIWVDFTLNGVASNTGAALFGLTSSTPATTGSAFPGTNALGYQVVTTSTTPQVRAVGTDSSGGSLAAASGLNSITVGTGTSEPNSVAIEFSSTGTHYTYFDTTNGTTVSRTLTSTATLASFTDFALGRLMQSGPNGTMTIDQVDIYSGNLTSAQIASLTPEGEVPEPSTMMLFLPAALFFLVWGQKLVKRGDRNFLA